jgi:hypothetical protein
MDDSAIISLFVFIFSAMITLMLRIHAIYKDLSCKIMELTNKLGEVSGKIEMIIKYMNNNKK